MVAMGTLSLHGGPLLTLSQSGAAQVQCKGADFKLGCSGWEVFSSKCRRCSYFKRVHAYGRIFASIGFTADPRVKIERSATGLLKDAAMLLVYQDVIKAPPAQAFLRVLLALRRGDDGLKVLESYGEFFKLMAISRSPSWEDFLLDGILSGDNNPFAEAAASATNPRRLWSGGVSPALQAAAASDLDSLQRLNISESTLSGWVAEIVSDVRPEWRAAAAATLSSRVVLNAPSSVTEVSRPFGFAVSDDDSNLGREERNGRQNDRGENVESHPSKAPTMAKHRDFVSVDRERWRKKIGGLWKWSEAVPMLQEYYAEHGVGRVVSTQALHWKGGKLARDLKLLGRPHACELTIQAVQRDMLLKNLRKHAKRSYAQHVALCGPSGSGKSWLLSSALNKVALEDGLRVVSLPNTELKSIGAVLEELGRHWNARFALVADDLFTRNGEESFWLLKTALDGGFQEWPENVLLCVTSLKSELPVRPDLEDQKRVADLNTLFGLVLHFKEPDNEQYITVVEEIFKYRTKDFHHTPMSMEEVTREAARIENNSYCSRSVRHAAQLVKTMVCD